MVEHSKTGCRLNGKSTRSCPRITLRRISLRQVSRLSETVLAAPGPVVVEAIVDAFVPPRPPKVTADQAAKFGEALLKGTPNRDKIALTVLSNNVKELI